MLGHGGVRAVAQVGAVSETTVRKGVFELEAGEEPLGRVRRPGGGRKRAADLNPGLRPPLLALVEPDVRGDPMPLLRWTVKSTRTLAQELTRAGHRVSADTVADLLRDSTSRSAIRGAFGRSSVTSRRRPPSRIWAGGPNRSSSIRTAGCCNRGPSTRSSDGWIRVSRPCSRFATQVASPARSSSTPTIISSSTIVSSSPSIARSVCRIARAASAMTKASYASVFALPG